MLFESLNVLKWLNIWLISYWFEFKIRKCMMTVVCFEIHNQDARKHFRCFVKKCTEPILPSKASGQNKVITKEVEIKILHYFCVMQQVYQTFQLIIYQSMLAKILRAYCTASMFRLLIPLFCLSCSFSRQIVVFYLPQ